jgi:hypothetical protein
MEGRFPQPMRQGSTSFGTATIAKVPEGSKGHTKGRKNYETVAP